MSAKTTSAKSDATGSVEVTRSGDAIHHVYRGNQTGVTVAAATEATDKIVAELQAAHKPVLILSDFSGIGDQNQEARDQMQNALSTRYFDRIAAFGVPPRLQVVGRLLLTLTGKGDRVRIFDTKAEAEDWLREFVQDS